MNSPLPIIVQDAQRQGQANCLVCGNDIPAGEGLTARYGERTLRFKCAGCLARFEAAPERPRTATRVLQLIAQLYQCEARWDEAKVGEERAALRQEHLARPLARLKWLGRALQNRVLPQSGLGKACAYLLGHWTPLTAHLPHSQTRLDTNAVENAIRPSKLGAKNWLFVGHPDAGDRPAVIYSLLISAQRRGLDPHAYLKDVLSRLPAMTTKDDITPLLPAHWHPASAS